MSDSKWKRGAFNVHMTGSRAKKHATGYTYNGLGLRQEIRAFQYGLTHLGTGQRILVIEAASIEDALPIATAVAEWTDWAADTKKILEKGDQFREFITQWGNKVEIPFVKKGYRPVA